MGEEMSGSITAKNRRAKSKNQMKIQAGMMFMTTATCMLTWTLTKPLLVTLQVLFAPITMPSWMQTKMISMIIFTEHSSNDGDEAELCDPIQPLEAVSAGL